MDREDELLASLGSLSSEDRERYQKMAADTLKKDSRINIRLSSRDLDKLRQQAAKFGMPYQTLIASILHQYVTGEMVRRPQQVGEPPSPYG